MVSAQGLLQGLGEVMVQVQAQGAAGDGRKELTEETIGGKILIQDTVGAEGRESRGDVLS